MKPRIVLLSAFLTPFRSGAEACAEEVALRLREQYDIAIITAKLSKALPRRDSLSSSAAHIAVLRVGIGRPIDKWLFPFLAPFAVRRLQPDIVHAVLESYAGLALAFCRFVYPRAKRILTCQSTNTSFLVSWMHRSAHAVTAISSVLMERARTFGCNDAVLIPNGIPMAAIERARKKYEKVSGRVLFVGRLEQMKGVDTLLAALATIAVRHELEASRPHLHIVGAGSLRPFLEKLTAKLGIVDRVTFLGYVSGDMLYKEYAETEVFCGLSRSEALGNVFLEAQAAGCAIVASNVGGIPDIVQDGKTGLLVPPDDAGAAAAALRKLLSDKALRARFGAAAINNAAKYDWDGIAKKYGEVYERAMSDK